MVSSDAFCSPLFVYAKEKGTMIMVHLLFYLLHTSEEYVGDLTITEDATEGTGCSRKVI